MSNIQPIYIYTLENTISFTNRKTYIITELQPNDKRHLYRKYQRLENNKIIIYCSKNLSSYDFDLVDLPKDYLAKTNLISFDELLELMEGVNKSNDNSWDLSDIVLILQLIIAKWDDWH